MADVTSFIKHAWQNIWKQKRIWLFSALTVITPFVLPTYNNGEKNLGLLFLQLLIEFVVIILSLISFIGVRFLAYNFSIGKSATIQETLDAVNQFLWRVIGCSCIAFLLIVPCFFLVFGVALQKLPRPEALSSTTLVLMPLYIFACLGDFTIFGFFENDWGIRKSIKNAWKLYTAHFGELATLGISLIVLYRVVSALLGIVTVLAQSGFHAASLNNLNIVSPFTTLSRNPLFMLINGISEAIFSTLSASVFALAYLKYSGGKNRFTTKGG